MQQYTDDSKWPERTYESFTEWFEMSYVGMVEDISDEPLEDDDYEKEMEEPGVN